MFWKLSKCVSVYSGHMVNKRVFVLPGSSLWTVRQICKKVPMVRTTFVLHFYTSPNFLILHAIFCKKFHIIARLCCIFAHLAHFCLFFCTYLLFFANFLRTFCAYFFIFVHAIFQTLCNSEYGTPCEHLYQC